MAAIAKPLAEFPILTPASRRWRGPIVDAHMHAKDVESMRAYWDVAETYGVRHAVVIADLGTSLELKKAFGDRVQPAVWGFHPRTEQRQEPRQFRKDKEAHLERIAEAGFRIVKLWFTPRFHDLHGLRLDDPVFDFFFERVRKLRLAILIHVADPDYWFAHQVSDLEQYGTKAEHYLQLVNRLEEYPEVTVQAAHFGGHPEDLEHLARLLERYPKLYLDSSATKWVAREFSNQGKRARDFLIQHADRVLFGTDLVADPSREKEGKREHYATRFYVHQRMWEHKGRFDSPIEDEDTPATPRFRGLDLPEAVLGLFYWGNAARLHGFRDTERRPR